MKRWDLERLATSGAEEDRELAEQGLAEWADELDRADQEAEKPREPEEDAGNAAPAIR